MRGKPYGETLRAIRGMELCIIMRHDVDFDLEKALYFSEIEHEMGISSTYFVLMTGNFYNIFSKRNKDILKTICSRGHSIGLHFDETQYDRTGENWWEEAIENEISFLERCICQEVASVSMHRPSKGTLKGNWSIRNGHVANSYGKEFFGNHKYLSDSRRNWKVSESGNDVW